MCHYAEIECLLYGDRLAKNKKHKKKHPEIKKNQENSFRNRNTRCDPQVPTPFSPPPGRKTTRLPIIDGCLKSWSADTCMENFE